MSTYSQPVHTITISQKSISNNNDSEDIYQPKYLSQLNEYSQNITKKQQNSINRLPLNLFHSTTQYNKMLILNGKNRKKKNSAIIDGVITSLQYVNDHIFQKQLEKQSKTRNTVITSIKPSNKNIQNQPTNCVCCCCQDFCNQCTKNTIKCQSTKNNNKLAHSEINKIRHSIDEQIKLARQGKLKYSNNNKNNVKHYYNRTISHIDHTNNNKENSRNSISYYRKTINKNNNSINNNKNKSTSKREYSSVSAMSQKPLKAKPLPEQTLSHPQKDISHLIMKSLIEFNVQRKHQQLQKLNKQNNKKVKQQYLQQLNNQIRTQNLQFSRLSRSKRTQKSISKHQTAIFYWQKIRNQVIQSIKNDNYSKPLKQQLAKFQLNVYQHKQAMKRKIQLNQQEREYLRKQHQIQAIKIIQTKNQQKLQKTNKIKMNLKHLEKERLKKLGSCQKKSFKPTADMIQNAFKNIVEADIIQNNKNTQIFKNQKIKKSNKRS